MTNEQIKQIQTTANAKIDAAKVWLKSDQAKDVAIIALSTVNKLARLLVAGLIITILIGVWLLLQWLLLCVRAWEFGELYGEVAISAVRKAQYEKIEANFEQAIETVEETMTGVQDFYLTVLTVSELRQLCKDRGIQWRNAHGQNKHLKKDEMIEALEAA